jgi:hypothetical protein
LDAGRKFLAVLSWRTALARNCLARQKKFSIEWRASSRKHKSAVVNASPPNVAIGLGQPGQSTAFDRPVRPPVTQQSIVHPELTTDPGHFGSISEILPICFTTCRREGRSLSLHTIHA